MDQQEEGGLQVCVVCKENETARLMDGGWGKKLPVCTDCLTSGRWRELLPEPTEPEGEGEGGEAEADQAEAEAEAEDAKAREEADAEQPEESHKHRYTRSSDTCKVPGCDHVRVRRAKK